MAFMGRDSEAKALMPKPVERCLKSNGVML